MSHYDEERDQKVKPKRRTKPPHEPTKAMRDTVSLHAMVGTPQLDICTVLGIGIKTLRKYYRKELDTALVQANATIGGALFNKAKSGDTSALLFWLKSRAGFREREREKDKEEETVEQGLTNTINKLIDKLPN